MTELRELINVVLPDLKGSACPFEHFPRTHNKKNELPPPPEVNNAKKLSDALDDESKSVVTLDIRFKVGSQFTDSKVQYTAHHLIPGNETWAVAKNQLRKWVDKKKNLVKGDIGYNVNAWRNGVDLPGNSAVQGSKWTSKRFQNQYAFAAMEADKRNRQFHDRHPAYSDFALACLNKIAAKLDGRKPNFGCVKKNCGGGSGPPYDPPYAVLKRIHGVASRLQGFLHGTWRNWRKPIMTSRFALMYAKDLSQDESRGQLQRHKFTY